MPISVPIGTYNLGQETHSFKQSDGFSRVHWRVLSNRFASVSFRILFSTFSVTTRLTLSVPQAEGHLISPNLATGKRDCRLRCRAFGPDSAPMWPMNAEPTGYQNFRFQGSM